MNPRPRILVAEPDGFSAGAREILERAGDVDLVVCDREGLREGFARYDLVWFRLAHRIDAELLGQAPRCKVLATPVTGLDHIDLEACAARRIRVVSLKGDDKLIIIQPEAIGGIELDRRVLAANDNMFVHHPLAGG